RMHCCVPPCTVATTCPVAETCNEPCLQQCPDSTVVIQPPPTVLTFPGPILSSVSQQSTVGSTGVPYVGAGLGGASGPSGGSGGFGG
ncbi:KRCL protein, partial [Leptocoma aspasia]|nr:KRCL protein [Leptocoma aspasia]